ncbi:DUF4179 domain-containing protein [Desulfosporosinus sp. BG]|uniref:DUF4179 domain-containing protein n=1 Tax=Desulfosporosinus sp. BG TaxID=1633135 RepID=UPI00083AEC7D|nr:DUF4179 domain-containing protein [Desulfosporosinus sp. BG]ODA39560.1 hypothetical protein DSBG_3675 [Desulfosporosinus sp. BG]
MDDRLFDEFLKGKALEEKLLLPSGLTQKITSTFRELPKKKKYHTKLLRFGSVAAILGFCVLTSIWFASPSFASNVSFTITNISSFLGLQKNLDEYKTVINKEVTDNSITVKLNEVILNGNELTVSYSINSSEKLEANESWHAFNRIYVNGKQVSTGASGVGRNIDDYTSQEVLTYSLNKVDLSADLNIKILCSSVMLNDKETKGSWDFEFKTNGSQLKIDTKRMLLNHKFTLENGGEYTLTNYTDNALGQEIYASISNFKRKPMYAVELRGIDDLGNKVEFYMSHGGKEGALFKIENINGNLNENAKTLTLTPYAAEYPDKSGEMNGEYKQVGDKFTIDLSLLK